jgi:predicted transcriptional regulator
VASTTTIQLTSTLKQELTAMKVHPRETYQQVLERVLEDLRVLDSKTRKELARAEAEIERGLSVKHRELGAKLGF